MYQFCRTFRCTPTEYRQQDADDIDILLLIEEEAKKFNKEELEKNAPKSPPNRR